MFFHAPSEHKIMNVGPTEPWSVREKLCLASSVMRSGDQNWWATPYFIVALSKSFLYVICSKRPSGDSLGFATAIYNCYWLVHCFFSVFAFSSWKVSGLRADMLRLLSNRFSLQFCQFCSFCLNVSKENRSIECGIHFLLLSVSTSVINTKELH